jgi:hypothetical protein
LFPFSENTEDISSSCRLLFLHSKAKRIKYDQTSLDIKPPNTILQYSYPQHRSLAKWGTKKETKDNKRKENEGRGRKGQEEARIIALHAAYASAK